MNAQHTKADVDGLARKSKTVPAAPDPLAAFCDALDELIEFAQEDAINAGRALPGGRGAREPDVRQMDNRYAEVMKELGKLLTPKQVQESNGTAGAGLLTIHNPTARIAQAEGVSQ